MLLSAGALVLAAFLALMSSPPKTSVEAQRIPAKHLHLIASVNKAMSSHPRFVMPAPRRRLYPLDTRAAINLVAQHELRKRAKRPPPGPHFRGPPPRGPPRPRRWKGPPKRKGNKSPSRSRPWESSQQVTRGSSPEATRVRYRSKPGRKSKPSKSSKSKSKSRPPIPSYADGYAEDEDIRDQDGKRSRKKPSKGSKSSSSYPKGWGPDGGYRVPAPKYPPYETDEEEPGTGHLDLEERFINQHNQFYQHGYPLDNTEADDSVKKKKKKGYYDDGEIELASSEYSSDTHGSKRRPSVAYRNPSSTRYNVDDEEERNESQEESHEYKRPSKSKTRSKKKGDSRRQNMFHAKFREDDRPLSAVSFNYELSGSASETSKTVENHRPSFTTNADAKPSDLNFFRTRKPQYWG